MLRSVRALEPLIGKLGRLARLDEADKAALLDLPFLVEPVRAHYHLVREGDRATHCCLLLDGYAHRHKIGPSGSRQIVSFHFTGDVLDIQHLLLPIADHDVQTFTPATVAWIPISALRAVTLARPAVGEALWRDSLVDASIFREWVLNVGQRDAKARVAHLLCEFAVRREAADLGSPTAFELPMSQDVIGDATGLSGAHVNRTLRALREAGVIDHRNRALAIADWRALCRVADFRPNYLHLYENTPSAELAYG